ncbi:D-alanyl-D-alanine carboxypeptidase [Amaricoccus solimangrovi]|uniref:D-alanyl-D-alanine carboxypeptidase n=1 Tax=Amaricoccus solimangrovi TaxID=2589815 RepID=A0A501WP26_9RHOB|nr:D-alanyl-D-alanine carboxypeptidase [Amaricoccus solimangrovi]TPE49944.1 D-alanyl-D-alanine carboxypeptidase [Amaricoccus solimangrovi]
MSAAARPAGPSRRDILAGLAAIALGAGAAPGRAATGAESTETILARSGLARETGFVVVDLATGAPLEAHRADRGFPPASVVKILTALYTLDTLGSGYRFRTRVIGAGGDLVLMGDGAPGLDTDALGDLAREVARRASGARRLFTASGALPAIEMIDRDQPPLAAYNPAISGLNLNYNRAFLSWSRGRMSVSAPGERFEAPVAVPRVVPTDRARPGHGDGPEGEVWRIPRAKLAGRGGLWLPVREPAAYAGGVFSTLLGGAGLGPPAPAGAAPAGTSGPALAEHLSDPAVDLVRSMLFHSTNLTAETLGLRASQARGAAAPDLARSAGAMENWARGTLGLEKAVILNHSGLTEATRIAPADLAGVLIRAQGPLSDLLRERKLAGAPGEAGFDPGRARLLCKTGTLDFVSALAGYLTTAGRRLAFVIFAADPAARARIPADQRDNPPGAKPWAKRARGQEQALLRRWVEVYGG